MSREKTEQEVREEFLSQIRVTARYWARLKGKTDMEKCEGVAFSILSIIDGSSCLPAFDLLVAPHESDKQYHIDNDEDYYKDKMLINDCMLHEMFHEV